MTQKYEYASNDLLKNPQKYQMTKYKDLDFLLAYQSQRKEIIYSDKCVRNWKYRTWSF